MPQKSGCGLYYSFMFKGKKYYVSDNCSCFNELKPGDRFYVVFLPVYPQISDMQITMKVHDSIKTAPPEGWERIP